MKSYIEQETNNPDLVRNCDWEGDWTHYKQISTGKYLPAVNYILGKAFNKGDGFYRYLLNSTREEADRKLKFAGNKGSRVHQAISDLVKGHKITLGTKYNDELSGISSPLTFVEWRTVLAFISWAEEYKPKTIWNEHSVCNEKYAGTLDWFGEIEYEGKKILCVIDFKTSSAIWGDYPLQLAAYWGTIKDKTISTAVLRIGTRHKKGYEFVVYGPAETKKNYLDFLSVYSLYQRENEPFDPKDIKEMPDELSINIETIKWDSQKILNEKLKSSDLQGISITGPRATTESVSSPRRKSMSRVSAKNSVLATKGHRIVKRKNLKKPKTKTASRPNSTKSGSAGQLFAEKQPNQN